MEFEVSRSEISDKTEGVKMPTPEPSGFVVTLNQMGYMAGRLDAYSEEFCNFSATAKHPVLEIGAAYGIATLKALEKGVKKIYSNDLDKRHLAILQSRCPSEFKERLELFAGAFPDAVELPNNSLSAILISRVLHFFRGDIIEKMLNRCFELLTNEGKLFLICDTMFMKNWSSFLPEYYKRVAKGDEWPGLIENSEQYENARFRDRQKMVNLFDSTVMENVLKKSGFLVEKLGYLDQSHYPSDMVGSGKESVGAIAIKKT